ncbi:unnamed protein product, partial [Symbiodinium necroappetens]
GKQWQLALQLFSHSPSRNAVAASAALSAFAKADENAVSVALLRSLAGLQVEPSAAAFNAASSTRYWKESLFFLLWGEVLGVAATAASAGAKVKAFESGGQWQSILSLGRLGTQPGGGAAGMVSAVSACEEASEWARTTALLLQAPLPPEAQQAQGPATATRCSRMRRFRAAMPCFAVQGWRAALSSLDRPDPGLLLALLALFEPTLSNRLARQEEADREAATVPCGCNNKVGVLAPKHALPGISIAADAECSRPKVHKSLTGGKYCSCDEGKARNWKEALGEAQAEVEKVLEPKLDAMKKAVAELEESLGIEIDASSLSKVRFLVRRFPRKAGQGLWACCCQSQAAGKCQKDAEMESRFWRSGFHHE